MSSHTPTHTSSQHATQAEVWPLAFLIGGRARVRIAHWNGRKQKLEYRERDERDLTEDLPPGPAAVMLYNSHGMCQTLVADIDVPGREGAALTHEVVALLERCGGHVIVDRSPAGKHHVYLPLRDGLSVEDAGRLAKALARRWPGIDPLPHTTGAVSGCIRTPGSPYKTGTGHQELVTPLDTARRTLLTRNGSDVLRTLEHELADELAAVRRDAIKLAQPLDVLERENPVETAPLDEPVLSSRMLLIAREGRFEDAGYADRSTARQAVLTAARRAGMNHTDVIARIESGVWPGLAAMYQNASTHWRRLLTATEWPKAVALVASTPRTKEPVRNCNTSEDYLVTRGAPTPSEGNRNAFDEHRYIRRFRAVLRNAQRTDFPGRRGRLLRMVLEAFAAAGHKTGDRYIEFGVRNHSLSLPRDATQVSRALVELRSEQDPWIVLERDGRGTRGDLYRLRIPDRHLDLSYQLPLERGMAHGLRPAFRILGIEAADVFAAVERGARTVSQIIQASGVGKTAVREHLGILQAWRLVEADDDGEHIAHPERLQHVAEQLGADVIISTLISHFKEQRKIWRARLARHGTPPASWWDAVLSAGPPPLEDAA